MPVGGSRAAGRALNIPARYVTGHLPDIGHVDPGTPMDFTPTAKCISVGNGASLMPATTNPELAE